MVQDMARICMLTVSDPSFVVTWRYLPGLGRPRNNESLTRAQSSYVHHACRYVEVPRVRGRTAEDESWRF